MAIAGAYGILRVKGLSRTSSGWGRSPRFFNPKIISPVPVNISPTNPPATAQQRAINPPAMPVMTNAVSICDGPIQTPIAAHNFTSPIPIPPIQQRMPKKSAPTAKPSRLCSIPCHPCAQPETTSPATRKGSTSQFGILRLRRSVNVATATTIKVGHQATECIPDSFSKIE
jgi:hypothetical protein